MRIPLPGRSLSMLALAIGAGLCAAWAARETIQDKMHWLESQAQVPTVERVVAAHDLPAGTVLGPQHMAVRPFPRAVASSDSLPPHRHAELDGSVLTSALRAGDAILAAHTSVVQRSPFSSRLAEGRRAITMPVDAINSVSGLLQPGDLIDLYVSFEHQRRRITAPLLQGVLVLATGAHTQHDRDVSSTGYSTVTLDAAPEDAVKLVAARQNGTLTAVLRHPHDSEPSQKAVRGDLASLLGVGTPPPTTSRKIPVLYGNQSVRSVPSLAPQASAPRQASGVFDLPYLPELASGWTRQGRPVMAETLDVFQGEADGLNRDVSMSSSP